MKVSGDNVVSDGRVRVSMTARYVTLTGRHNACRAPATS